ncbi:DUF262 domain-containing protein [Paludibacter jiangxiensis]|uniref:Uncharacterized protein n=1 Tax=Paludibacter jiangxiensis TaxID=681398 RepID=A0A171AFJ9_9BACT|nr:DUF262 domain-containing protein [Paludibacter jiangxiensis]GAT63649.1 hypothetical protein PJIAN_4188 [Paludibacter jiangxiensis]
MSNPAPRIVDIREFLKTPNLKIPDYQRPYKWTDKNVNQLIDDIQCHTDKSAYRLGTVVIHQETVDNLTALNIVDGQQRTITLLLIVMALIRNQKLEKIKGLADYQTNLSALEFSNDITIANIQNNYRVIERRINEFDEATILFFFNKCQLVQVTLNEISEAFQFFDSQNARGKDLEPHDLLKAYHLREMNSSSTEAERKQVVEKWEEMDTENLSKLFAQYLFRIRNWSKGASARYFSKNDVDVFKGVSPEVTEDYPFTKMYRIAHYYTEEYNQSMHRNIQQKNFTFPFQLDQTIINGKRFFEMIGYYDGLIKHIKEKQLSSTILTMKNSQGYYRTGDKYVRNLFYCGLIYYIDKFGEKELDKAIDKIFIWAFTLRLKLYSVGIDSVDNYALNRAHSRVQLFKCIREAIRPNEILNIKLEVLTEKKSTKTDTIEAFFKEQKYYEPKS